MAVPAEVIRYNFADYLEWDEYEYAEILYGEPVMHPAPTSIHQKISMEISRQIANYLDGKKCEVFAAPFTVRLFEKKDDRPENVNTVVQPDISVVCDLTRLDSRGYRGAPDMVIEILSPSTQRHDRVVKFNLYQRAGVREYWFVSPEEQTVQVFLRNDSGFLLPHESYSKTELARVQVLDDCVIDLSKVFANPYEVERPESENEQV